MENSKKISAIIKLSVLALIIIGVPAFLYMNCRDTLFDPEWLRNLPQMLQQYKEEASFILAGMQVLQVIICIVPGQPIQFAASYMYGIVRGYLISIIGAFIGATVAFYISKLLGRDAVGELFGEERIEDYRRKLNSGRGLMAVLLIYLIPGVPKDLTAYAAGVSDLRIRPFLIVSTIGRSPAMLGSLLFGHFFGTKNYRAIAVLAAVTVIALIIFFIKRKSIVALLDDLEKKDEKKDHVS
jgi:uncharacterized membrane protein YdjX (TVP38/TMEM64 family)